VGILGKALASDAIRAVGLTRHLEGLDDWASSAWRHCSSLAKRSQDLAAQGLATEAAIVSLLAATTSLRLSAGTPNNLFHPSRRSGDPDATRIEGFDADDVACLQILFENLDDPWLRARVADVASVAGRDLGLKMWHFGQMAARAYLEHCERVMLTEVAVSSIDEMQRGVDLAAMFEKRNAELQLRYWTLIEAAIRYSLDQGWPGVFLPLSELVRARNRALGTQLAPLFDGYAVNYANQGEGYQPDNAQTCFEIAARFWERGRDDAAARRCQQAAAEVLISRSRLPASAMLKADWMSEGIAKLRQYGGNRARIRELQNELADVRRTILDEMQMQEFSIDLREMIDFVRATVVGPTDHECLMQLAYGIGQGPRYDNVRNSVLDNNANHSFADMFVRVSYNEHGVPVAKREAFDRTNEDQIFQKMIEQVREIDSTIYTPTIFEAIDVFCEKFEPSLNSIIRYMHQSPGVPDGHEDSIARGLAAGFNYDWLEVAAYLIPQSEAIVRNIFKRERVNTLVYRDDGTEEEMSLNQLLECPQAAEVLGKDFVFQLRALLTEKAGFNLRNLYCHGLLTDDGVHQDGLFMLWWVLLRMTLFVPWGYEWYRNRMDDSGATTFGNP
jgi:hypothetical protein